MSSIDWSNENSSQIPGVFSWRAALVTNLPNYASAIVSAEEIVDSISSLETLAISAEH